MPSYSTLIIAFTLTAAVCAFPVDELSARNAIGAATSGVGGQADGGSVTGASDHCPGSSTDCTLSKSLDASILKLNSENAGNGGSAPSGAAEGHALLGHIGGTNPTKKLPVGSGFSGAGGEARGGSVTDNRPALIELNSDNAGQGGRASSGKSSGLVA